MRLRARSGSDMLNPEAPMKILVTLGMLLTAPAFAGFWCNGGSDSAIFCNAPGGGYWCTGTATAKFCRPLEKPGFWCNGSATALFCNPPNAPGYWCTGGSSTALFCNG